MKKLIAILMAALCLLTLAACAGKEGKGDTAPDVKGEGVMTYAEYAAAPLDSEVFGTILLPFSKAIIEFFKCSLYRQRGIAGGAQDET